MNNSINDFLILEELGRGSFGITYKATRKYDNKIVAIKFIYIDKPGVNIDNITEEITTLKDLNRCKYVIKYYGSFMGKLNNENIFFIVMEYADGYTLDKLLLNPAILKNPIILWNIIFELIIGLKYIHDNGYAHRDIKPDNIMINKEGAVKYIDFGLSCLLKCKIDNCSNTCSDNSSTGTGTPAFIPLEIWNKNADPSLNGAKSWDIWSLSLVILLLVNLTDQLQFEKYLHRTTIYIDMINSLTNNNIQPPNYTFDDGRTNNFVNKILVIDWIHRPNIDELLTLFLVNGLSDF